jgi:hypothetical protein
MECSRVLNIDLNKEIVSLPILSATLIIDDSLHIDVTDFIKIIHGNSCNGIFYTKFATLFLFTNISNLLYGTRLCIKLLMDDTFDIITLHCDSLLLKYDN